MTPQRLRSAATHIEGVCRVANGPCTPCQNYAAELRAHADDLERQQKRIRELEEALQSLVRRIRTGQTLYCYPGMLEAATDLLEPKP